MSSWRPESSYCSQVFGTALSFLGLILLFLQMERGPIAHLSDRVQYRRQDRDQALAVLLVT